MDDLFGREQQIYDRAIDYISEVECGTPCLADEYILLAKEYGRLLRQIRRVTKISDKTTDDLNMRQLDLLDKIHYDTLTGIYNRRFMEESLHQIITSMAHSGGTLSVFMMDVDFFKKYNDTYGHSEGDECLKAIAKALNNNIQKKDSFVARYGGEEFIAVLPNTDEKEARVIAEQLLNGVRSLCIRHEKNSVSPYVTISIGITTGKAACGKCGMSYIKQADNALYCSKRNGRNRYTFAAFQLL